MGFEDEVLSPAFILAVVVGALVFVVRVYWVGFVQAFAEGAAVFLLAFVGAFIGGTVRRALRIHRAPP